MKLNPQNLKKSPYSLWSITISVPKSSGRARAITTSARTLKRCCSTSRASPLFTILDFGCGPGRDLKAFIERGHNAIGLDGAEHFVTMARAHSGREVWRQDFLQLELPDKYFDGVFANAALFHVPRQELPRVLLELHATLKPGGVLFSSNPRGDNQEGWNSGRYCVFHDLEAWRRYASAAVEQGTFAREQGILAGAVTLPCEKRERSTPYAFSSRRDGLAPRGHRRGA